MLTVLFGIWLVIAVVFFVLFGICVLCAALANSQSGPNGWYYGLITLFLGLPLTALFVCFWPVWLPFGLVVDLKEKKAK